MLSVPPAMNTSPCSATIFSCALVIASNPLAQLRWTVYAGISSGMPALRAMTRATLAASGGWATQPKMTCEIR